MEEEKRAALEVLENFKKLHLEIQEAKTAFRGTGGRTQYRAQTILRYFEYSKLSSKTWCVNPLNLVRKSPQATVCILKDLKTGKFTDSANGFKRFLKVPEDGVPEKEFEVRE